jgi:hypothetical protein
VPIELVPLATATITLATAFVLPGTPAGTRMIAEVEDAVIDGDRLRGRMKGKAAADWLTMSPEAVGTVDVRALFETNDDALVYCWYHGRLDLSKPVGSVPVYTAPLFETGDERYRWLNTVQAVGKGAISEDGLGLVYELYELR